MFITCLTTVSFNYTFEITVIVYPRPLFIRIKMKKILSVITDLCIYMHYSFETCYKLSVTIFSTSIKTFWMYRNYSYPINLVHLNPGK